MERAGGESGCACEGNVGVTYGAGVVVPEVSVGVRVGCVVSGVLVYVLGAWCIIIGTLERIEAAVTYLQVLQ